MVEIGYLHVNFYLNYGMDTFKTSGNKLHGYLKDETHLKVETN